MVSMVFARLAMWTTLGVASTACGRVNFEASRLAALEQHGFIKASVPDAFDYFGHRVALSDDGSTLAVGARWEDSAATTIGGDEIDNTRGDAGAAFILVRTGAGWTQQAYLKADVPSRAEFGFEVALSADGDTLLTTAPFASGGDAFVFTRAGTAWSLEAKLTPPTPRGNFGYSAAISDDGNTIAIGDLERDSRTGAAYVYTRSGATWSDPVELTAPDREPDDIFGDALALSGDGTTLVVGAPWEDSATTAGSDNSLSGAGAAYLFRRSGQAWGFEALLKAGSPTSDAGFGSCIAISQDGRRVAIAAGGANAFTGAAHVFDRDATVWRESAVLSPAAAEPGDEAAWKIALSHDGRVLVFGARSEESAATGVDGDPTDDSLSRAGAAWVFVADPTWREHAFLKADHVSANDSFGADVAVAGSTIIVGAPGEATGTGGLDPSPDQTMYSSGAVYVFE